MAVFQALEALGLYSKGPFNHEFAYLKLYLHFIYILWLNSLGIHVVIGAGGICGGQIVRLRRCAGQIFRRPSG